MNRLHAHAARLAVEHVATLAACGKTRTLRRSSSGLPIIAIRLPHPWGSVTFAVDLRSGEAHEATSCPCCEGTGALYVKTIIRPTWNCPHGYPDEITRDCPACDGGLVYGPEEWLAARSERDWPSDDWSAE